MTLPETDASRRYAREWARMRQDWPYDLEDDMNTFNHEPGRRFIDLAKPSTAIVRITLALLAAAGLVGICWLIYGLTEMVTR